MKIAVAGAGLMGCGIAARFAAAGYTVQIYDSAQPALHNVHLRCGAVFGELVEAGLLTEQESLAATARIRVVKSPADLCEAEVVFEAIIESLDAKQALFAQLEQHLAPAALIASSTSGFTPQALSRNMHSPQRFLVAHFWNPPHLVPLVEVVGTPATAESALARCVALLRSAGCEPVLLHKAVPGFIGNRFQFAVLREALHLLREGVADADTIDSVMKQSVGRRYAHIGPLEGADVGGLDTFLAIAGHLMPELAKDESVLDILRAHVQQGHRGRASGQGFHTWDEQREAWLREARRRILRLAQ
jgi:3-hydroxybutyryl-CoA dehydrogenase